MNFENALLPGNAIEIETSSSVGAYVVGPNKTNKGNLLTLDAYNGIIAPNATLSVKLTADCLA